VYNGGQPQGVYLSKQRRVLSRIHFITQNFWISGDGGDIVPFLREKNMMIRYIFGYFLKRSMHINETEKPRAGGYTSALILLSVKIRTDHCLVYHCLFKLRLVRLLLNEHIMLCYSQL